MKTKSIYNDGFDFEVIKAPIFIKKSETDYIRDEKKMAILNDKTDKVISYMDNGYRLFNNAEFTALTEKVRDNLGLEINHYATHNDGAKVLSVFNKLDKVYKVGDYTFNNYVVLYDARDGSRKLSVGGTGDLHRCENMFTTTKVQFSVYHNSSLDSMLKEFEANLIKYAADQKIYIQRLEGLMDIKVDKSALYKLVSGWVQLKPSEVKAVAEGKHVGQDISTRKSNIITDLSRAYDIEVNGGTIHKKGRTLDISGVGETGFGLLNTITHYYTHNRENNVANLLFSDFGKKEKQVIEFAETY
jgi:hypothetical protein